MDKLFDEKDRAALSMILDPENEARQIIDKIMGLNDDELDFVFKTISNYWISKQHARNTSATEILSTTSMLNKIRYTDVKKFVDHSDIHDCEDLIRIIGERVLTLTGDSFNKIYAITSNGTHFVQLYTNTRGE